MKLCHLCLLICTFPLATTENCLAQSTMVPRLTRSADNSRSGWNQPETKGIFRATIIPVIGDARGVEAQPLILPNVKTTRGTHDVMVLPSMADVVRGVDAHDGSGIWQVTLGTPITGLQSIDSHQINQFWGCLSTGVIDADTQRFYQVCWVSPDKTGNPKTGRYFMFVLNVADGKQIVPPVLIQGRSGSQDFNGAMRKQRSSLVETNVNGENDIWVFGDDLRNSSGCCFWLLLCLRCGEQHGRLSAFSYACRPTEPSFDVARYGPRKEGSADSFRLARDTTRIRTTHSSS